jgi:hypothetical protein
MVVGGRVSVIRDPGEVSQVWTQVGGSRPRLSDGVQHSVCVGEAGVLLLYKDVAVILWRLVSRNTSKLLVRSDAARRVSCWCTDQIENGTEMLYLTAGG